METLENIVSGLENPHEIKRIQAVISLVKFDDIRVIPHLQRMAERDESAQIRYLARKGLKVIKDRAMKQDVFEQTVTLPGIPQAAVPDFLSPDDIRGQVKFLVSSTETAARRRGFKLGVRLNDSELFAVLQVAYIQESDPALKSEMIQGLAIVGGTKASPLIKNALKSKEHRLRANAVEAAAMTGDEDLIRIIVPLLQDGDHRVAANAAVALKEFGVMTVVDRLSEMLEARSVNKRDAAAHALSRLDSELALPHLIKASLDKKKTVRLKAVKGLEALAGKGHTRAQEALDRIFADDQESLTDYFSLVSEEQPVRKLDHKDFQVRLEAVKELVRSGNSGVLTTLKEVLEREQDNFVKATIIRALGELGSFEDVEAAIPYLSDSDPRVRANAVETVGLLEKKENLGRLVPFLHDHNNRVRANAVVSLKEAYPKKAVETLNEMAGETDVRMKASAAYACLEIASEEAVEVLGALARDGDVRVSEKAVSSLGMLKDRGNAAAESMMEKLAIKSEHLATTDSFVAFDDGSMIQLTPDIEAPAWQKSVLASLRSSLDIKVEVDLKDTHRATTSSRQTLVGRPQRQVSEQKYIIAGEVGRGGMGIILNALDTDIRRQVAMKVISGGSGAPKESIERFVEEVQVQGQLEHPHICPVHELGTDVQGRVYFTMKMVKGSSLAEMVKQETETPVSADPRRLTDILGTFLKICDGLAYAHSKGVIHRDLKPGNIMVGDFGEVYVMDWGLARIMGHADGRKEGLVITDRAEDRDTMKTMSGSVVGTPAYMPPEQARGLVDEMDERSDIYSLGALLYELLTTAPPFTGRTPWDILERVCGEDSVSPSLKAPEREIPPELDAVVLKCLAKDREERYQSVQELKDEIALFLAGRPIGAMEYNLWQVFHKWVGRNRVLASSIVAILLVIITSVAVSHVRIRNQMKIAQVERDKAEAARSLAEEQQQIALKNEQVAKAAQAEEQRQRTIAELRERDANEKLVDSLVHRGKFLEDNRMLSQAMADYTEAKRIITESALDCHPYINLRIWKIKHGSPGYYEVFSTLKKHHSAVTSLGFSPDGTLLVSGSDDNTVLLWDWQKKSPRTWFSVPGETDTFPTDVRDVAFSPDGRQVAAASEDNTVRLWDLERNETSILGKHGAEAYCLAFRPDGKFLASGGRDNMVRLWSLKSRRLADVLIDEKLRYLPKDACESSHQRSVWAVAFHPDGRHLASGSVDKKVKVWDLSITSVIREFGDHGDDICSLAFSPDGKWLASGAKDHIIKCRQWREPDWEEKLVTFAGHGDTVNALAFHPDGDVLFSGSNDSTVRVWDTKHKFENKLVVPSGTGTGALSVLRGHSDEVLALAVSPDGTVLASGSEDDTVKLWRSDHKVDTLHTHFLKITQAVFSPDGNLLAYGTEQEIPCSINLLDTGTGKYIGSLMWHQNGVLAVAFSPDGRLLVSGGKDDLVKLWDVKHRTCLATFDDHAADKSNVNAVAFSPDGSVFVSGSDDQTIRIYSTSEKKRIAVFTDTEGCVESIAFSRDGSTLAAGVKDGHIRFWDMAEKKRSGKIQAHDNRIASVVFSPDGKLLASGSFDNTIKLWSVETKTCLGILRGHLGKVFSVSFHPDGNLLASGSVDKTIKLWNIAAVRTRYTEMESGENTSAPEDSGAVLELSPLITFYDHNDRVTTVAFSPDGGTLVSGSFDFTLKNWLFGDAVKPLMH